MPLNDATFFIYVKRILRMKKIKNLQVCVGVVALISAGWAMAGNRPGAVTLTFSDAYYHFDSKQNIDSTSMPNFALAYNATENFALEGGIGVLNSTISSTEKGDVEGEHAHGFLYTIDGLYRFGTYKIIEPYVTAGIGVLGMKPNGNESTQQGLVNAGIGAQAFFDKSLALRAEFRELYTTTGSGFNDYMLNFGISYLIGGY
jgi:hypothetical protein